MMKRKRGTLRWIVTIAAAASVGLLVFSSMWGSVFSFTGGAGRRATTVLTHDGTVWAERGGQWVPNSGAVRMCVWLPRRPSLTTFRCEVAWPGFFVAIPVVGIAVPLTAAGVWMWFPHFRRRARVSGGACPACGYGLSGSPGSVCPECGRVAAGGAEA